MLNYQRVTCASPNGDWLCHIPQLQVFRYLVSHIEDMRGPEQVPTITSCPHYSVEVVVGTIVQGKLVLPQKKTSLEMGHNFQEPTLVNPQIAAIPRYSYKCPGKPAAEVSQK